MQYLKLSKAPFSHHQPKTKATTIFAKKIGMTNIAIQMTQQI
jgi:hypothetical protein